MRCSFTLLVQQTTTGAFRLGILQSPKDFATDGPKGYAYLL